MNNQPNNPEPNPHESQPNQPQPADPNSSPELNRDSEQQPQSGVIGMAPSLRKTSYAAGDTTTDIPQQLERHTVVPEDAGRMARLNARLIDSFILGIPYFVAIIAGGGVITFLGFVAAIGLIAYQFYLLHTQGQTIGKQTMNIRIILVDSGENGGFVRNVLLREFVNAVLSFVPFYSIADILFIFREDQRCIHDHIAGTKVVQA